MIPYEGPVESSVEERAQPRRRALDPLAEAFLAQLQEQGTAAERRHVELVEALRGQAVEQRALRDDLGLLRELLPTHLDARRVQYAMMALVLLLVLLLGQAKGLDTGSALKSTIEAIAKP